MIKFQHYNATIEIVTIKSPRRICAGNRCNITVLLEELQEFELPNYQSWFDLGRFVHPVLNFYDCDQDGCYNFGIGRTILDIKEDLIINGWSAHKLYFVIMTNAYLKNGYQLPFFLNGDDLNDI